MQNHPEELLVFRSLVLADTGVVAKASEAKVCGGSFTNSAATIRYLKIYNKATAAAAADTPVLTIGIPTLQTVTLSVPGGLRFSAGISLRCVTTAPDAGAVSATSGDVLCQLFYK